MSQVRAQILTSHDQRFASARITIRSSRSRVFDLLANPRAHQLFDGSGSIQGAVKGPDRLFLAATFSMAMKIKVPYRITNTVVVFEENQKISWCHLMKWVWSYDLIDLGDGQTQVTESFDGTQISRFATWWLKQSGAMIHNPTFMAKSLVRLKSMCET